MYWRQVHKGGQLLLALVTLMLSLSLGRGEIEQQINFFLEPFDPEDMDATMCPLNTTYPVFGFGAMKIPDLRAIIDYELSEIGSHETIGLWATYSGVNYNSAGGGSVAALYGCEANHDPEDNPKSMRYLGNEDASLPGLSLFFGSWPDGEETYVDGAEVEKSFDEKLKIGFWALTGPQNWTLFSDLNFSGESTCVMPNEFGFEWGYLDNAFVGSVRLGCDPDVSTMQGYTTSWSLSILQGNADGKVMIKVTKQDYRENYLSKLIHSRVP